MKNENAAFPLVGELAPTTPKEKGHKAIVFAKRDKKAAISSTTHGLVEAVDAYDDYTTPPSSDSQLVRQEDLERWILRWKYFREMDDHLTLMLSRGATVEKGVHTAKLVPWRDESGRTYLKVFVR